MNARGFACGRFGRSLPTALSILLPVAGCSSSAPISAAVARPVKTMIVTACGEPHTRSFSGKVDASKKVELAFQVSGLLVKLAVKEGQKRERGSIRRSSTEE